MAFRRRMKVHDRHDGLVFIHALCRLSAANDRAKDAILWHVHRVEREMGVSLGLGGLDALTRRRPRDQRLADLPVVAKRVLDPTEAPPVLFTNGVDHRGPGRRRAGHHGIGILDDQ